MWWTNAELKVRSGVWNYNTHEGKTELRKHPPSLMSSACLKQTCSYNQQPPAWRRSALKTDQFTTLDAGLKILQSQPPMWSSALHRVWTYWTISLDAFTTRPPPATKGHFFLHWHWKWPLDTYKVSRLRPGEGRRKKEEIRRCFGCQEVERVHGEEAEDRMKGAEPSPRDAHLRSVKSECVFNASQILTKNTNKRLFLS